MEPRLTLLVIWLLFTSRALLVESQNHPNVASPRPSPSPPPQPPSLATSPHPPMSSPSPPPRRVSPHPPPRRVPPPRQVPPPRWVPPHPPPRRVPPHPPPPPPPAKKMNSGKKIGLLFVGIAGVLQIGVVAFLVLQRRRLLSMRDRYENCSS